MRLGSGLFRGNRCVACFLRADPNGVQTSCEHCVQERCLAQVSGDRRGFARQSRQGLLIRGRRSDQLKLAFVLFGQWQ